jgi:hypothetical protein
MSEAKPEVENVPRGGPPPEHNGRNYARARRPTREQLLAETAASGCACDGAGGVCLLHWALNQEWAEDRVKARTRNSDRPWPRRHG